MKRDPQCDAPKTPDLAAAAAAGTWAVSRRRKPHHGLMAQAAFVGDTPPTFAPGTAGPQVRRRRTFMAFAHFMVSALLRRSDNVVRIRRPFSDSPSVPFWLQVGILCALCGVACASATMMARQDRHLATGTWGGEHLKLVIAGDGAHLEFDCASGEIAKPLVVDDKGHFVMDGVFVPQRMGPARMGDVPDTKAARYEGQVDGEKLTLDVVLKDTKATIGHYVVTLGTEARLRKCA